jgi:hypothetical protein
VAGKSERGRSERKKVGKVEKEEGRKKRIRFLFLLPFAHHFCFVVAVSFLHTHAAAALLLLGPN